ncbi:MAG: BlaI/MecI/CopY family transcriptional regulator [Clostridia bacterium]|nr:BlaI/MecI/CopY family transcriptional regulator [Clostridia bacterium]MBQ9946547.1 BlaI/MecI/CopY family transcriptional regulator [Clostridia bacterium]
MIESGLGVVEGRFAEIIWSNEPVSSAEIVKLAEKELGWKKSTTFTVLRRLCEKGIFINNKGTVTSLISKQDFFSMQSEKFVDETFGGSLPAFVAAFTKRKKLSKEEIEALKKMVSDFEEE